MGLLDDFCRQRNPTREDILDAVDEYTLYCHYLDMEDLPLKRSIFSPLRTEKVPSFEIYPSRNGKPFEFLWKDNGMGMHGTIFDLIKIVHSLSTYQEAYALICQDFSLDFKTEKVEATKIVLHQRPVLDPIKLRIHPIEYTSKGEEFWRRLNIGPERRRKFEIKQIDYYWSVDHQEAPTSVPDPTFAYTVGQYYQIYSPFAPRTHKWRNDLPENYFLGYLQLPKTGDKLIIDKSLKDVAFDDVLNYPAACGKSETTMIPPSKMHELRKRFKRIFLTLDPDETGRRQTEKYMALYPWLEPRFLTEAKDKTDLCLAVGFDKAKEIINQLIQ